MRKLGTIISLFGLLMCLCLNGCANYKENLRPSAANMRSFFSNAESVHVITVPFTLVCPQSMVAIKNKKIRNIPIKELSFTGTVSDFGDVLRKLQIPCSVITNDDTEKKQIRIPYFTGTFYDLASILAKTYGLIFEEVNKTIIIKASDTFSFHLVSLPKEIREQFVKGIEIVKDESIKKISYDPYLQILVWQGDATSPAKIHNALQKVVANYAKINFEVVVFEAKAEDVKKAGLKLGFMKGNKGSTTYDFSTGIAGGESYRPLTAKEGMEFAFSSTMSTGAFNSLLDTLIQWGKARTLQKPFLSVMNTRVGTLEIGTTVPYVASVTREYHYTNEKGRYYDIEVEFGDVLSGMKIELEPTLNRALKSVYSKIGIEISSLVRMVEIKSGEDSYSRPEVTTKKINTEATMELGKVYVFGGFSVDSNDKTIGIFPTTYSHSKTKSEILFAIRPTVTVFQSKTETKEEKLSVTNVTNKKSLLIKDEKVLNKQKSETINHINYLRKILTIAHNNKDKKGEIAAMLDIGKQYISINDNENALLYLAGALEKSRKINNKYYEAVTYKYLGLLYKNKGEYKKAREYLKMSVKLAQKIPAPVVEEKTPKSLESPHL